MLGHLFARNIFLYEFQLRSAIRTRQQICYLLVVFGNVLESGESAPVGGFDAILGLEYENRSFILIRLSFPRTRIDDGASHLPVGPHIGPEQILLHECWIYECFPYFRPRNIYDDGCFCCERIFHENENE